ncbi:Asparagine-rich protein (ARP protein) [Trifolium repens]|nr:Asparagine-rich protein (ARP protein) [Trifolium repens]
MCCIHNLAKVAPLLARSNLLITRAIEWVNLVLGFEQEQRDGRSYNRGDMYEISHTKRNGSYVNDEARQKNEELQKERQTSSDNEAFVTVFGKEHHGYVRGMGLGPTPSQINGSSCRLSGSTSSSTADAKIAKMLSEIDVLTKEVAEVNELKAKVAEFDAMKEQFALIMANMQNHGSSIGSPFEVRRSSESSHNVEGDQATPDD